jgi:hypothetical protein
MLLSLLSHVLRLVGLPLLDSGTSPSPGTWPSRATAMMDDGTYPSPGTWPPK